MPDSAAPARAGVWTVVVAAGSGQRFGGPKQFEDLGGRPVVAWAVEVAAQVSEGVVVVLPPDGAVDFGTGSSVPVRSVSGGDTRSASVRAGLAAVPDSANVICVHDAARPFATVAAFAAVIDAVRAGCDGAVPGVPVTDTVKVVDPTGTVVSTPDRSMLRAVQTPQAFVAAVLRRAHSRGTEGTDDAALVEALGGRVAVVAGDPGNRKLTDPADLAWARDRVSAVRS